MRISWRAIVGALAGATGAVVWAVTLAIYQPFMEPHGFFTDPNTGERYPELGSNNSYWPRDIRHLAILLVLAAVVLIAGPRLRALGCAAVASVAWLGADLWLDRVDIAGHAAAAWLAVAGVVAFAVTAAISARLSAGQPDVDAAGHVLAGTVAVLAVTAVLVTTPWEEPVTNPDFVRIENALVLLKAALVVAFAAVAAGLVVRRLTVTRAAVVGGFTALAALGAWPATGSYGLVGAIGLVSLPVAASLAVVAARDVSPPRLAGFAGAAVVLLIPSAAALYIIGMLTGTAMTSIAGNPPVNGADTDLSLATAGLALGLLLALAGYVVTRPAQRHVPSIAT